MPLSVNGAASTRRRGSWKQRRRPCGLWTARIAAFNGARMRWTGSAACGAAPFSEILGILDRARITGELCLREAVIGDGRRDAAFAADGLVIDGDMDCARMRCQGPMLLRGARISGSLACGTQGVANSAAQATRRSTRCHTVIGGTFDGQQLVIEEVNPAVEHPRGGNLRSRAHGWTILGPPQPAQGVAITSARRVVVPRSHRSRALRLAGARVGGRLELPGARLDRPDGIALNLDRATVAEVDATGLVVPPGKSPSTACRSPGSCAWTARSSAESPAVPR